MPKKGKVPPMESALKAIKMRLKHHKVILILVIVCGFIIVLKKYISANIISTPKQEFQLRRTSQQQQQQPKHLLWWNSMPSQYDSTRYCGLYKCTFTTAREDLAKSEAVLFYASDIKINDMPLPRQPHQLWSLLHEESPRNVPYMPHTEILQHFNFTSTFSRYSDFPLTTHYLADVRDITSPAYVVPIGEKTRLRSHSNLAAVAFLQSDCDTMSGRDDYVQQLMQHIKIDSYGQCLHNRDLPKSLTENYLNNLYSPELFRFLARYKFVLAYENGVCHDYITEKFWRPLVIGAIPIYFGSPSAKDWQPNKKSIIHIADFASPKHLAEFIKQLDGNDSEYNTYLDHKYEQLEPIKNKRLLKALRVRDFSVTNGNLFGAFECFVCRQLHELKPEQTQMATLNHYNCPLPLIYPPMQHASNLSNSETNNVWRSVMAVGKCQAEILNKLWQRNLNYTEQDFNVMLNQAVELNQCNN